MIDIRITDTLSPALLKAAAAVPGAIEAALNRGQGIIDDVAGQQERRIEGQPIPRSAKGKPLWTRSGKLAASRSTTKALGQRTTRWSAIYAARRFGLGYAWTPKRPAGGVIRRNDVPTDTARIATPRVVVGMTEVLLDEIGLK